MLVMTSTDILIVVSVLAVIGIAVAYIVKEKKNGAKCIGCPDSKTCSHRCAGCTGECPTAQKKE